LPEPYCPETGDIVWLRFDPQAGREQAGRRRALVLTPRRYNRLTRLCVLCPITSQVKGYPFEVRFPEGTDTTGVVLADQVKSLSWEQRGAAFVEPCPPVVLAETKAKIKALLGV
jgi:mRNA interferase MazF